MQESAAFLHVHSLNATTVFTQIKESQQNCKTYRRAHKYVPSIVALGFTLFWPFLFVRYDRVKKKTAKKKKRERNGPFFIKAPIAGDLSAR